MPTQVRILHLPPNRIRRPASVFPSALAGRPRAMAARRWSRRSVVFWQALPDDGTEPDDLLLGVGQPLLGPGEGRLGRGQGVAARVAELLLGRLDRLGRLRLLGDGLGAR